MLSLNVDMRTPLMLTRSTILNPPENSKLDSLDLGREKF